MIYKNRVVRNSIWIIGCHIIQAMLSFVVTMLTARYLGPSNYGLINYAASLVAFLTPIAKLGLDTILINEFVTYPEREGETLGTSMVISLMSSILCIFGLITFVSVANQGEPDTIIVCALYSVILIANVLEMTKFWFQTHLLSKYTSIATLVAYVGKAAYQIFLLANGSSIYWFAITNALDIFLIDIIITFLYKRNGGQSLGFSWSTVRRLLSQSRYYIISSMMVTIFANTDRVMIKMLLGDMETGYYSAAVTCANMTSFIFAAIINSAHPVILKNHKEDEHKFNKSLTLLYSTIIYLAVAQSIVIFTCAPVIVNVLYGNEYLAATEPLRWIVWYTLFSYIGSVNWVYVQATGNQAILWKLNLIGAIGNVALNALLIPAMGVNGAAIASLLTQIVTNLISCFIFHQLRPILKLMKNSLSPKNFSVFIKK